MFSSCLQLWQILLSDDALILQLSPLSSDAWQAIWEDLSFHHLTLDRHRSSLLWTQACLLCAVEHQALPGCPRARYPWRKKNWETQNLIFLCIFHSLNLWRKPLKNNDYLIKEKHEEMRSLVYNLKGRVEKHPTLTTIQVAVGIVHTSRWSVGLAVDLPCSWLKVVMWERSHAAAHTMLLCISHLCPDCPEDLSTQEEGTGGHCREGNAWGVQLQGWIEGWTSSEIICISASEACLEPCSIQVCPIPWFWGRFRTSPSTCWGAMSEFSRWENIT